MAPRIMSFAAPVCLTLLVRPARSPRPLPRSRGARAFVIRFQCAQGRFKPREPQHIDIDRQRGAEGTPLRTEGGPGRPGHFP